MKKLIPGFLPILVMLLVMCSKNEIEDKRLALSDDYLPLEIGNFWQFGNPNRLEVSGTKTVGVNTYFILSTSYDSSYYRKEGDKVFVIEDNELEALKFDLSADVNDTWNFGPYVVKMVSKDDMIEINGNKIVKCYQFYFDVPDWIDEEYSIWLAPGIGFIQKYNGMSFDKYSKLIKASIGGVIIDF